MIEIVCLKNSVQEKAAQLAKQLGLPLVSQSTPGIMTLQVDEVGLSLQVAPFLPLRVEWTAALAHRVRTEGKQLPLAKAIGIRQAPYPVVLDATAGLGRDSLLLAALGCQVHAVEQHPVLHALLVDALELSQFSERITVYLGDSVTWMSKIPVDVIYVDPMFPPRQKSALVKKDMQILHQLDTLPDQAERLLSSALTQACSRVVIKRPLNAEKLVEQQLTFSVKSKTHRFDVYVRG